jgi:hypothetical protein
MWSLASLVSARLTTRPSIDGLFPDASLERDAGTIVRETRQGHIYGYHFFEDVRIRSSLVWDESYGKNTRICVPWHSPNAWVSGATHGILRPSEKVTS